MLGIAAGAKFIVTGRILGISGTLKGLVTVGGCGVMWGRRHG